MSLVSKYTKAEAYNGNMELMNVQLRFEDSDVATNGYRLYQNMPNPFRQETSIGFELPEAMEAILNVYNLSGSLLHQVTGNFEKGYNQVSINSSDLTGNGLMYYHLIAGDQEFVKKMIVE